MQKLLVFLIFALNIIILSAQNVGEQNIVNIANKQEIINEARAEKSNENYSRSIELFNSIITDRDEDIPPLFELANIYIYADKLAEAIDTYQRILEIDDTWAEAWSGIGKMLWWQDKPFVALDYYKKAMDLDPTNKDLSTAFTTVKKSTNWNASSKFFGQSELEEEYNIYSFHHEYSLSKRITDKILVSTKSLWQYAQKDEAGYVIEREYDTSFLKAVFQHSSHNHFNFSIGGSISDSTLTVIDAGWKFYRNILGYNITNNLNIGNEYFYHWKNVRRNYISNNLQIKKQKIDFRGNYQFGKVEDYSIVIDSQNGESVFSEYNSFLNYSAGFTYQLTNFPQLKIGGSYRFMDYQYSSSLYYSPIDRKILSLNGSFYLPIKSYYAYFGSGIGFDNYRELESNFDLELGFNLSKISFSISYSNFKNTYYENNILALIVSGSF